MRSWQNLKTIFTELQLADKCLLLFMTVLLYQSIHNLFFHEITLGDTQNIDIVIRTLSASIFGYFISSNFQNYTLNRNEPDETPPKNVGQPPLPSIPSTNKINFRQTEESTSPPKDCGNIIECRRKQQILIVTTIGLLSLVVLTIARNLGDTSDATTATISQLRDFASGSVGFLLAYSKQQK